MASMAEWQKVLKLMEDVRGLTRRVVDLEKEVASLKAPVESPEQPKRRGRPPKGVE